MINSNEEISSDQINEVNLTNQKEQKGKFIEIADKVKGQFVSWVDKRILANIYIQDYGEPKQELNVDYLAKKFRDSPSKEFFKKTLALVGLYDIGLTIAGIQMGLPKEVIFIVWSSTFFAPVCEELMYRSRLIPGITKEIAKQMGINIPADKGRALTSIIFSAGHFPHADLDKFLTGAYLTKVANEKGLVAAMASHQLINASILGVGYLIEISDKLSSEQAETVKAALLTTLWTGMTTIGIAGIKELIEDKQVQEALERIKSSDKLDKALKIGEMKKLFGKLLSNPSTKGYKFLTGVELSYTTAMLEAQEFLHQKEMQTAYAEDEVRKAVETFCPNLELLEERLAVATYYISGVKA